MLDYKPGDIIEYDFRSDSTLSPSSSSTSLSLSTLTPKHNHRPLRLLQWNIERGYQLTTILSVLKSIDADILGLQELDIGCGRSGFVDTVYEIARALKLHVVFVVEFIEVESKVRRKRDEGSNGVHGNAILSKYKITNARVVQHRYQPVNWEKEGMRFREPRRGQRYTIAAEVQTPGGVVLCYSAHLEVFCGILGRLAQMSEILQDARESIIPNQIIFGDLNTMAHGIARFSHLFCQDIFRFLSLGSSEAEWWDRHILSVTTDHTSNETVASMISRFSFFSNFEKRLALYNADFIDEVTSHVHSLLLNLRNPGFADPFDVMTDMTLRSYMGYYYGKLDWVLMRGFRPVGQFIGGDGKDVGCSRTGERIAEGGSDHYWLVVDAEVDETNEWARKRIEEAGEKYKTQRQWLRVIKWTTVAVVSWTLLNRLRR